MKICNTCNLRKDFKFFGKRLEMKDNHKWMCKSCENIKTKIYNRTRKGLVKCMYSHQLVTSKRRNHNKPLYNLKELRKWIYNQKNFEELYNNWIKSWYNTNLIPSIDRLNNYEWYSFDNIQLITWEENNRKK